MIIIEADMVEKQEAADHAVLLAFGMVGTKIETCHGANAGDNTVVLDDNDPTSSSLEEVVSGAVAHKCSQGG
jgi:hypothetical protein